MGKPSLEPPKAKAPAVPGKKVVTSAPEEVKEYEVLEDVEIRNKSTGRTIDRSYPWDADRFRRIGEDIPPGAFGGGDDDNN